jgi:succinate dehydrogenase / fumarate reductase flavoprotein subunit
VNLDSKIPAGPMAAKWDRHRAEIKLVNPSNKRKFKILIVGSGLAAARSSRSVGFAPARLAAVLRQRRPAE